MIFNSRKLRYAEKTSSQCHFVHPISHADSPGSNLGLQGAKSVGTGLPVSVWAVTCWMTKNSNSSKRLFLLQSI